MVHNIDTVAANADPAILGYHIHSGAALTTEVIARHLEDRGGGLARVDGRVRLIEGLALPSEELESQPPLLQQRDLLDRCRPSARRLRPDPRCAAATRNV